MLNFLEGAAWFCAIALILKMLDYQVPFAHHLDGIVPPAIEQVEPEADPKPVPNPFDEGQTAQGFLEQWETNR